MLITKQKKLLEFLWIFIGYKSYLGSIFYKTLHTFTPYTIKKLNFAIKSLFSEEQKIEMNTFFYEMINNKINIQV